MGLKKTIKGSPGKSESHAESGNLAYPAISQAFTPALGYVTQGGNAVSALLGLGDDSAGQKTALENFSNSAGMEFMRDQGNAQINSNQAAKGLLNSGSTLKGLEKYGQGLGQTYLNQYMQNLFGLGNLGLGAGGVMSDAGKTSTADSKSSGPKKGMYEIMADAAAKAAAGGGG